MTITITAFERSPDGGSAGRMPGSEHLPTLYTTAVPANGRKVLAVARHLAVDLEVRSVNVYRGEGQADWYLRVNPQGKVPALVDGDFVLWESNAILVTCPRSTGSSSCSRGMAENERTSFDGCWESSHWQPMLAPRPAPNAAAFPAPGCDVCASSVG